ncbi:MAG: UDP-N-acetylglucosamine 2-epimerase (non-hydrolyzing) [Chloroflexi bacterium]|nr:UDP-N-acetylglucosamine 2-epimerase (non-hydrolyzing) [Chloroflexota bacterium]
MKPKRILTIFGTRPEAVKMAPVVLALKQEPNIEARVCVTAQHRQLLDQVLKIFEIEPDYDLDIMHPDQSLAESTAAVFSKLDPVLKEFQPSWALVQGDTTTVMAASLLAYYNRIKVGHVEAGLRTNDKWQPFPEEINRRVAGVVADLHFAATEWAKNNLIRENIPEEKILVTGNPVIDALNMAAGKPYDFNTGPLKDLPLEKRLVLVTAHRRENFGEPLERICAALRSLAGSYADTQFIYPVHPNPNVTEPVHRLLAGIPNIILLPPLDYLPWVHLMKKASLILTDSGGLQEEAPGLGIPVLVMRALTERPEGVEAGVVKMVGTDVEKIIQQTRELLDDPEAHAEMAQAQNPYGDGKAASRIVKALLDN